MNKHALKYKLKHSAEFHINIFCRFCNVPYAQGFFKIKLSDSKFYTWQNVDNLLRIYTKKFIEILYLALNSVTYIELR
jgi:hypothetical protein